MSLNEEVLQWESAIPKEIASDALWHATAYRLALFVSDRCRRELERLAANPKLSHETDQLGRALASISANYAEAYSRSSPRDRTRFYEYSLGSAREARDWCFKIRHALGDELAAGLLELLTRITQLLTVTIVRERGRSTRLTPRKRKARDD